MTGVCTACAGMFETTEEDARTPGVRCPSCHFLLKAYEHVCGAIADLNRAFRHAPAGHDAHEAYAELVRLAPTLKREARP